MSAKIIISERALAPSRSAASIRFVFTLSGMLSDGKASTSLPNSSEIISSSNMQTILSAPRY